MLEDVMGLRAHRLNLLCNLKIWSGLICRQLKPVQLCLLVNEVKNAITEIKKKLPKMMDFLMNN